MEYVGWVCGGCNRAINSGKSRIDLNSIMKCKICGKTKKLSDSIHSKKSFDSLEVTEWVKQFNNKL